LSFRTPVRDLMFSLTEVAGFSDLHASGGFPDYDAETAGAVLEAAGQIADEVIAPLSRTGDQTGARLEGGRVIAAPGYREAWKAFVQVGWPALSGDPEHGGQGAPKALAAAMLEATCAADLAFSLCPILTMGAADALDAHGDERQKILFLPKLVSGEWTGTMNLTEPQAGSDLALVRTRAEPDGAGGYRLYGQKIFITWGDHDCAENVVHLVLARLPDAPEGVKGISLFLAPKHLVDAEGRPGELNAISVGGIEHKLGIHASPTCTMLFEGAAAELVGAPNGGLACMFTMMNAARLLVGVQGVGVAERAFQKARDYALERRQGRSPWSADPAALLVDQPDVRRALVLMKARIEAARGICFSTAVAGDLARCAATDMARAAARRREDLLTPIAKAWSTDVGVEVASSALQVHGGMGFIEETGAAQLYRDARILPIYEGTNGIQAIDLVGRKLGLDGGLAWRELIDDLIWAVEDMDEPELAEVRARLDEGVRAIDAAARWLGERRGGAEALAGATPFLKLVGDVTGGWMLAKGAAAALRRHPDPAFVRSRVAMARIYAEQVLAGVAGQAEAVTAGVGDLAAMDMADLAA
jgi:hypothetical protein